MNKESDFIKEKIDNLIKDINDITIRYGYDISTDTHFVEILPQSIFDSDFIMEYELNTIDEFNELFNESLICFFSEESSTRIKNIIYEVKKSKISNILPHLPIDINSAEEVIIDNVDCIDANDMTQNNQLGFPSFGIITSTIAKEKVSKTKETPTNDSILTEYLSAA